MSEGKHTPGPWGIEQEIGGLVRDGWTIYQLGDEDFSGYRPPVRQIVELPFGGIMGGERVYDENDEPRWPEDEANARLIAAAPEMLKMLQTISNYIDEGDMLEMEDEDALLRANEKTFYLRSEIYELMRKARGEVKR